jgi:ATP-dependent protease HslVU (ClpYQ) peptidase subunit
VIVAARTKTGAAVAADSLTTAGWEKEWNDRSKLWDDGKYVFGAAGCLRTAQVVRHWVSVLVREVVPAVRNAVNGAGVQSTVNGVETVPMTLLVATGSLLGVVHSNGAVSIPKSGRCAIGSGYAEALGALGDKGTWTVEQVVEAARRATLTAVGCEGAISYMTTDERVLRTTS